MGFENILSVESLAVAGLLIRFVTWCARAFGMRVLKRAIVEGAALGALALAVALMANAVRARGSIKLTKNYFDLGLPAEPVDSGASLAGDDVDGVSSSSGDSVADASEASSEGEQDEASSGLPSHTFREIDYEGVVKVLEDPNTEMGLNIFVDARSDDLFADGHIPGARQFYPYEADRYIDNVLDLAMGALNVVVYCGGGDCIDSILACRELRDAGVPEDALRLYEGGWTEWTAEGGPVERE